MRTQMKSKHAEGPKVRDQRHSYDESTNEPASLIANEPADVEEETPSDDTEPVERISSEENTEPPAFEE